METKVHSKFRNICKGQITLAILFVLGGVSLVRAQTTTAQEQGLIQLTTTSSSNQFPAWSPDGSAIYFASNYQKASNSYDIWRVAPDGSRLTRITQSPTTCCDAGLNRVVPVGTTGDLIVRDTNIYHEWLYLHLATVPSLPAVRSVYDGPSPYMDEFLWVPGGLSSSWLAVSPDTTNTAWDTLSNYLGACPRTAQLRLAPTSTLTGQDTTTAGTALVTGKLACAVSSSESIIGVSFSPDGSQFVIARNQDPNYYGFDLEIYNVDGTFVRKLTNNGGGPNPAINWNPSWSSDNRIAFASNRTGRSEIWTINVDGSGLTQVTTNGGDTPTWSPDASRIAFSSDRSGTSQIYSVLAPSTEQGVVRVTNDGTQDGEPAWSPDGKTIMFASSPGPNLVTDPEIWEVSPDGTNPLQVTSGVHDAWQDGINTPVWLSTTGGLVVFDTNDIDEWMRLSLSSNPPLPVARDVYDGDSPYFTRLLYVPGGLQGASFALSSDGASAAWTSATTQNGQCPVHYDLRVAPFSALSEQASTTGAGTIITSTNVACGIQPVSYPMYGVSFSPDGSEVVLSTVPDSTSVGYDLYIYKLDGTLVRRLTTNGSGSSGVINWLPTWSSDNRIAFASNSTGKFEIWTISPDGTNLTRVTTNGGNWPTWSPDASRIAFTSDRSGAFQIYSVLASSTIQTSEPQITSISPTSGIQGQTISDFTVNGNNFSPNASLSFSGTGVAVNYYSSRTSTQILASVSIAGSAIPGARDVNVTNPDGQTASDQGIFLINASPPPITSGTITIDSNLSSATFTLSPTIPGAPTGGPYPVVLQNAPAGHYSITFDPVLGYITPTIAPQSLTAGDSIRFTANYTLLPQVLIVPGIFGTKLASQDDPNLNHCPLGDSSCVQWLSNSKIASSYIDKTLGVDAPGAFSALQYDSNGNPTEPLVLTDIFNFLPNPTGNLLDVLDCNAIPLTYYGGCSTLGREINVYDALRDRLQQAGFTVSSFPYDWRGDLPALSDQLYAAIHVLTQEHPQQPVALVAHSMGGLLVSEMLARHPDITSSLPNIVTLGTPFEGSANAYLQLQGWESLEPQFLSTTGTKELGQYWASPYFLLPQQDFVMNVNGNLVPNSAIYQGQFMPTLFPALARQAVLPITSFGPAAPKTLAIIGSGYLTTTSIQMIDSVPVPTNSGSTSTGLPSPCLETFPQNGDGTVSVDSAKSQTSGITQQLFVDDEHEVLPSNDAAIGAIISFLSGVTPATSSQLQAQPFLPPDSWEATVCSPVDLSAHASDGQTVANGLIEVQGASYISSPHGTEITIPANDQYDLKLRGTGIGTFTLILTERDTNLAVLQTTAFANIPVAPAMTGDLSVTPTAVGSLQVTVGATTLTLTPGGNPLTPADDIRLLLAIAPTLQLPYGISTSLLAKIAAASEALTEGDAHAAAGAMTAFGNEVQAQAGKHIPAPVASGLLSIANVIESLLSSSPG